MLRRQMLKALVSLTATAVGSQSNSHTRSTQDMIVELDRRLNKSILANDVSSAAALYDDEFLLTVSGGGLKRKADMLADIGNPAVKLSVSDTTDITVRVRGGTAILTGVLRQAGTVNGRAIDVKLRVTDTWVNVDGRWLLFAGHASLAK